MSRELCGLLIVVMMLLCSCQIGGEPATPEAGTEPAAVETGEEPAAPQEKEMGDMKITSTAFSEGEMIPKKCSSDGDDISPPLAWTGIPEGTQSLALIVTDPDAPVGTWTHWVAFNIPPDVTGLPEAIPAQNTLPTGGTSGSNSWGRVGYGGPSPPSGTHRYIFTLYALDSELDLEAGASEEDVEGAMKGHILGQAELMGRYKRA